MTVETAIATDLHSIFESVFHRLDCMAASEESKVAGVFLEKTDVSVVGILSSRIP